MEEKKAIEDYLKHMVNFKKEWNTSRNIHSEKSLIMCNKASI